MYLTDDFKTQFTEYLKWLFEQRTEFLLSCMNIRQDGELMFDEKMGMLSVPMIAQYELVDYLRAQGISVTQVFPCNYRVSITV